MNERLNLVEGVSAGLYRPPTFEDSLHNLKGRFHLQHVRAGQVIDERDTPNTIVTVGKNKLLDVMFRNQTQLAAWYFGLIDNAGTPTIAAGDTMASHTWTELTAYSDSGPRQAWAPGAASAGSVTNGTVATFNMNATNVVYGAFINSGVSGTSGILWSAAAFSGGTVSVINGDQLRLTYTLSC